ncbi:MAG: 50S ribosome-binding GTPase [Verrucomicrobia bacterium]|nr:50S ribosome-binding GTPase [Verrucomicrobiota bacterium]MBS0636863.1 50S ribosome-binding GTPase [Verrucomicrobiota bacterium]
MQITAGIPDSLAGQWYNWEQDYIAFTKKDTGYEFQTVTLNLVQRLLRQLGYYQNTHLVKELPTIYMIQPELAEKLHHIPRIEKLAQRLNLACPTVTQDATAAKEAAVADEVARKQRVEAKEQNIVIVGKSRSGKTTLMNMLQDVCKVGGKMTLYHGTVDPELHQYKVHGWNFNTLDTPGWLEARNNATKTGGRKDGEIFSLIRDEAKKKFGGIAERPFRNIDTFIFTFNHQEGIGGNEVECLGKFLLEVPEGARKILVVTRYEIASRESRQACIDQFKAHPEMKVLLKKYFANGEHVLLSGCLNKERFRDEEAVSNMQERVNKQSKALMGLLLPEAASNREAFLQNHAQQNLQRIEEFTNNEFPAQREEALLEDGYFVVETAEKAVSKSKIEGLVPALHNMLEMAVYEMNNAKSPAEKARAQALSDKVDQLHERFKTAQKKIDAL